MEWIGKAVITVVVIVAITVLGAIGLQRIPTNSFPNHFECNVTSNSGSSDAAWICDKR